MRVSLAAIIAVAVCSLLLLAVLCAGSSGRRPLFFESAHDQWDLPCFMGWQAQIPLCDSENNAMFLDIEARIMVLWMARPCDDGVEPCIANATTDTAEFQKGDMNTVRVSRQDNCLVVISPAHKVSIIPIDADFDPLAMAIPIAYSDGRSDFVNTIMRVCSRQTKQRLKAALDRE